MINIDHIKLYPMTQDVKGQRTHQQYVDSMALMLHELKMGYRLDNDTILQLLEYGDQIGWKELHDRK